MRSSPSRLVRILYRITVIGFWGAIVAAVGAILAMLFLDEIDLTTFVHGVKLPAGLRAPSGGIQAQIRLTHLRMNDRVLLGIFFILALAVFAFGLRLVRDVLGSVRNGDPFVAANVGRLRMLGGLFIVSPIVVSTFLQAVIESVVSDRMRNMLSWHVGLPTSSLITAALLFVLAEVFAHGVRLRDEVESTI